MYVLFPADEVVYLSYGRLIYLPLSPQPDQIVNTPIRTSLSNGSHTSFPSVLSTPSTNGSTRSRKSAASEPPPTTTTTQQQLISTNSFNSLDHQQPSTSRQYLSSANNLHVDQPLLAPVPPARKNKKTLKLIPTVRPLKPKTPPFERKLSYSDYLALSRDKTPQSPAPSSSASPTTPSKSNDKSPLFKTPSFKLTREKTKSLGRDRTPIDFDTLFKKEASPGKLSVHSIGGSYGGNDVYKKQLTPPGENFVCFMMS